MANRMEKRNKNKRTVFSTRLRRLMKERGWSGYHVARLARINPHTLYYYTRGEREPDISQLRRLMRAFPEISLDWMIGRSNYRYKVDQ